MIKSVIFLSVYCISISMLNAQKHDSTNLYNPTLDAMEQIEQAILLAESENKHVLIQVGGNWCPWCIKIYQFIEQHPELDSVIHADYVLIHVNYSKENRNPEAMARLDFPQRFGFPVFVILDTSGKRIHTQNTVYLEAENSYNEKIIFDFLVTWNRNATDPENYQ